MAQKYNDMNEQEQPINIDHTVPEDIYNGKKYTTVIIEVLFNE